MGWFSKKLSLKESGVFEGFIDMHSHILPGVDDGIQTMEESLRTLQEYQDLGFKQVWLTPHIMEDFPNEISKLKERFEELKENWKGDLKINLAAENMLDNLFEERLQNNDLLPIGEEGDHLLVETSYYTPPYAMDEMLDKARAKGYNLILAHPERYRYMEEKDYLKYKEMGLKFQMNILSLTGAYGETAKKKAEWLLTKDMIDFLGTDVHKLERTQEYFNQNNIKKEILEKLKKVSNQI